MKLSVFLITYNREGFLKRTLECLSNSILKDYNITVLDNCSEDDSVAVAKQFQVKMSNLTVISHKVNIGGDANIMRAVELSESEYTWILCDDDDVDLTGFEDVLNVIDKGEVSLIHLGAHPYEDWGKFGGKFNTPAGFIKEGYQYFKFASFLPCNLFRTKDFQKLMIRAYHNIVNCYPHMVLAIGQYEDNKQVYISKKHMVTASTTGQSYNIERWFFWWMNTCKLLKKDEDVRVAFFDHFSESEIAWLYPYMIDLSAKNRSNFNTIMNFVEMYFSKSEKEAFFKVIQDRKIRKAKNAVKTRLIQFGLWKKVESN